jgi:hypothetical protein
MVDIQMCLRWIDANLMRNVILVHHISFDNLECKIAKYGNNLTQLITTIKKI